MPIYAYRCDSCGARKDVLQKFSDAPLTECTECGAPGFRKELSAPAFQLKGSGWYVTDFRDNGKRADRKDGNGAEAAARESADSGDAGRPADSAGAASAAPPEASPGAASPSKATPAPPAA